MRVRPRTVIGLLGLAATLLLHAFLIAMAVWSGSGQHRLPRPPDAMGGGANTGHEEGEPGERRITVMLMPELHNVVHVEPPPQLADPAFLKPSIVEIADVDALPLPPIQVDMMGEESADESADLMARVKFAGIYASQIRARIERAWELPPGLEGESDFSCLVVIHQNKKGRVISVEIDLSHCEGSSAMRASLVNAINVASPLPAPPHPSVYVDRYSLELHSGAVAQPSDMAVR